MYKNPLTFFLSTPDAKKKKRKKDTYMKVFSYLSSSQLMT